METLFSLSIILLPVLIVLAIGAFIADVLLPKLFGDKGKKPGIKIDYK